jgi:hypothetical protein
VFCVFLDAHPTFAASVASWQQPDAQFPDVVVSLKDGRRIDFELREWLDGEQMAQAMRRRRLEQAIGSQPENGAEHIRTVMLVPRNELAAFQAADTEAFRSEIHALIRDTDKRWRNPRTGHLPKQHLVNNFASYPSLAKYLVRISLTSAVVAGKPIPKRPPAVPWIFVKTGASSYLPETMLSALTSGIESKVKRYGGFNTPVRLLVHYGRAFAYNTPYIGIETSDFGDVARVIAQRVGGQSLFEKIYLLNALEPGLEAYEIFPTVTKCN